MVNILKIIDIPRMRSVLKSFGKLVYIVEPTPYFNFSVGDIFKDSQGNCFKVREFLMVNWKPEDIDISSKFFVAFEGKEGITVFGDLLYMVSDVENRDCMMDMGESNGFSTDKDSER